MPALLARRLAAAREASRRIRARPTPRRCPARLPACAGALPPRPAAAGDYCSAVAMVVGVIACLAFSSVGNALVYYLTPTELLALGPEADRQDDAAGRPGEARQPDCGEAPVAFTLTDGTTEIPVAAPATPTRSLPRGGRCGGQGELSVAGVFEATEVIVKHDENYVAPSERRLPSQVIDPGTGT